MLAALLIVWAGFTGVQTEQQGRSIVKSVDLLVGSNETDVAKELGLEVELSAFDAASNRPVCSTSRQLVARVHPPLRPVSFRVTTKGSAGGTRDYRLHARVAWRIPGVGSGEVTENSIMVTLPEGSASCGKR